MVALPKMPPARMTVAEFMAWPGDGSGRKYQLVDGEPRAMAPASPTHGTIQATVMRVLGNHLMARGGECRAVAEPGIVPRVKAETNFRIPDIAVTCVPDEPGHRSLPDPILIVEILSPSNEAETWENIWAFTTIPSLREILVLHSTKLLGERLVRGADGNWPEQPQAIERGDILELSSIGFTSPLLDLYAQSHLVRSINRR